MASPDFFAGWPRRIPAEVLRQVPVESRPELPDRQARPGHQDPDAQHRRQVLGHRRPRVRRHLPRVLVPAKSGEDLQAVIRTDKLFVHFCNVRTRTRDVATRVDCCNAFWASLASFRSFLRHRDSNPRRCDACRLHECLMTIKPAPKRHVKCFKCFFPGAFKQTWMPLKF